MSTLKDEVVRGFFVPPRSWRAWALQGVSAAVIGAVILVVAALVTGDVPWGPVLVIVAAVSAVSAAATAWRIWHDKQ